MTSDAAVALALETYLGSFIVDRKHDTDVDFDADGVVAHIDTDDAYLYAELRGAGFDIEGTGESFEIAGGDEAVRRLLTADDVEELA